METEMKTIQKFLIWILLLAAGTTPAFSALETRDPHRGIGSENFCISPGPVIPVSSSAYESKGTADQDMDRFFKAKEFVYKRNWKEASRQLESYLSEYRQGRMRDEALYWLAYSLHQLARYEQGRPAILELEKAALSHVEDLLRVHPQSLWKEDASSLRVEIAAELVLLGETRYASIIDDAVRTLNKNARDVKIVALNSLAELDAALVLPLLRRTLSEDPDAAIRLRCLSLLPRFPSADVLPILDEVARKDRDEKVRNEAASLAGRVKQRGIPVRLRYLVYGCRLLDDKSFASFPENEVREIALDRSEEGAEQILLAKARQAISGEISTPTRSANGTMPLPLDFGLNFRISHRVGDYLIWFRDRAFDLSAREIRGEVDFKHLETNQGFSRPFRVDPSADKLLVARSGANLSLIFLQFAVEQPEGKETGLKPETDDASISGYGVLKTSSRISLTHGIKVHSERTDFALGDFEKNLIDLTQAKAEIPVPGGRMFDKPWILIGDLFFLRDQDALIGFGSTLLNPDREAVAEGFIQIPAGNPAGFKLLGGRSFEKNRKVISSEEEKRTRPIYPTQVNMGLGWTVLTTLGSWDPTAVRGKEDFGLSRAFRSLDGKDWMLIGQIISLQNERKFIARQAALIGSDGTLLYGAEIHVPMDDPAGAVVVQNNSGRRGLPSTDKREDSVREPMKGSSSC